MSSFGSIRIRKSPTPKKKVCNFVGGVVLSTPGQLLHPGNYMDLALGGTGLPKYCVRYADDVRHITRCQIPFTERKGPEDKTSGSTTYLEAKAEGDKSMSLKRSVSEGVYDTAPQDPRDTVRATLPTPQFPAMEAYIPCPQRLLAESSRYVGKVVAGGTFRGVSDAE